jgi:hypothetical protein
VTDIDLHDHIYFAYSEYIRDQQLVENGANGNASGYKRAAGNKMAIWERIRKSRSYELVKVLSYPCFYSCHQAFGISASDFGINVRDGTRRHWTEDPSVGPEEMAAEYSEAANTALTGALQICLS